MKAVRRWFIYRRLVNELAEAPDGGLAELGMQRKMLCDFAWHCAGLEVYGDALPAARHKQPHKQPHEQPDAQPLGRVAIDKA
jgi:hypothetical protein